MVRDLSKKGCKEREREREREREGVISERMELVAINP